MMTQRSTITLPAPLRERLRVARLLHPDGQSGQINEALRAFVAAPDREAFVSAREFSNVDRVPVTVAFTLVEYAGAAAVAAYHRLPLGTVVEAALAWCGENDRARFGWVTDPQTVFEFEPA